MSPTAPFRERVRRGAAVARLALGAVGRRIRPGRPYNVLRITLAGTLEDLPGEGPWATVLGSGRGPDLLTLLAALRSAREDEQLGLVLIEVRGLAAGWSRIQSLRRALHTLRASGKQVWIHLAEAGMHEYYLASVADRVVLVPAAHLEATGLSTEVMFLKGALDRLGIEAQLARAGRFKSAGEPLTRHDMSEEHRAMLNELLDDLYAQLVADVAADRGLDPTAVRAAFEEGPFLAPEALRRGLVDALAYPDEVMAELEERFGDPAPITLAAYRRRRAHAMRRAALGATAVGFLPVRGAIMLGSDRPSIGGGRSATWHTFRRALASMAEDPRLAAIVLRIDSPGGSGLASDLMWREIMQARLLKPILVSMADTAASGGYYLAAAADDVTAEGGTLTGSIGVLSVKPVLRGLYERLGVTKELVTRGNAARHSDYVRLDDDEMRRLGAEADAFYADFVGKVASGRGLSAEAVALVAEGRVWTGRQALARGLIDRLGGIEETLDELRRRLGLAPGARLAIERREAQRPLWQRLLGVRLPAGALTGPVAVLAPALQGERVLAIMPFVMDFVRRSRSAVAEVVALSRVGTTPPDDAPPAATGNLRIVVRGMRRILAAFGEPPLVM